MRAVHLDFVRPPQRMLVLRRGLAVVALLASAGIFSYLHWVVNPETERLQRALDQQNAQAASLVPQAKMSPAVVSQTWKRAQAVSSQLNLPWGRLFEFMGSASSKSLALLSVEPDPNKGQVVVNAEARDFDAMLQFVKAMQADEAFSEVALQSHMINHAVAELPIRFRLTARWKVQ